MSLTTRAAIGSRSQLAAAYHPGDGQISLATGGGAFWAGASSGSPGYLLLISGDEQQVCSVKTVYSCTGVTADVLTGVAAIEGVDQYFPAGSTAWLCTDTGGGGAAPSYNLPAFTAFAITGQGSPVEVGATISGTHTFTWSTSYSSNVASDSITIVDTTSSVTLADDLANSGSDSISLPDPISNDSPATQTWTINGVNTHSGTFSDTFDVSWEWRVYAGTNSAATLTANQIAGLSASDGLQAGFAGTYSITAGSVAYYYLCYPDSLGSVSNFIDGNTGFPISMATSADNAAYDNTANGWSYALVSVTNVNSVATNYRVYRTQYQFSGTLLMEVS